MRTDADHPARVRDPTIELLLSHTATLTGRYRGLNTQNSLPSGSAITTHVTSP